MSKPGGGAGRWFDRILGVAVLAAMGAVLLQPGGALRNGIDRYFVEREVHAALQDRWPEIAGSPTTSSRGVLVEFMDYQCPYCRMAEDTLAAFTNRENVDVVYRHYPLTAIHPRAEEAAQVAICADEAGVFQRAHTYLIREQWWEAPSPLKDRAAELGITDTVSFGACLTSTRVEQRIQKDRELGALLKVQGTPLFAGPNGVHRGLIGTSEIGRLLGLEGSER